jgi:riboflavin kinase/FMN adenylyltransferase
MARYEELVPKDGVYITWTRVGSEQFESVTNVGNRPTFGAELFAIETHLLNFHPLELTPDTEVEICFLERLRDEIKFPSVDALREQIARDVKKARRYFHLLRLQRPTDPQFTTEEIEEHRGREPKLPL